MLSGLKKYFLTATLAGVVFLLCCGSLQAAGVRLELRGLKGAEKSNVKAALTLPAGIERDGQINRRWLDHFVEKIPAQTKAALEPFGYYQVSVLTDIETLNDGTVILQVAVDQGPPVLLEEVQVRFTGPGAERPPLVSMVKQFPLKQGDQLNHQAYEESKLALRVKSVDLGYLRTRYAKNLVEVDPERLTARIVIEIETGPLFYFGEIEIDGAESYPPEFLKRYLTFVPGEIFSYQKLNRTRVNYLKAHRFEEILLVPQIDQAEDQRVPIQVSLVASPSRRLRPGVGYGTNTGARLTLNYQSVNITQNAHELEVDLVLAQKSRVLETSYTIPLDGHKENAWIFSGGLQYDDIDIYTTDIAYLEAERAFGWGDDAVASVFLRYHHEDYSISTQDDIIHLVMPGLRYFQRHYDDPVNPTRGFQYRLELSGSHKNVLSDISMAQFSAAGTLMFKLSQANTLHMRSEFGYIAHQGSIDEIPASMRYFVGGDSSVRGYAYKSRGPRDQYNDVIGGDGLLVGSLELEHAFTERYGGAVFYDLGSAFNAFDNMHFYRGAGFGVRIYTPVGPIKLDLARQLQEENPSWRFHLSVGFDI